MKKLRILVGGFLGILPAGGVSWDYLQYPLGLFYLGHDVFYVEDTRLYPIYQPPGSDWNDASSCVGHLQALMRYFGLDGRWAYRDEASGQCFGLSEQQIKEICTTADVFINISCSTFLRDEYLQIPKRVLIDSDPMFTQIQYATAQLFTPGSANMRQLVDQHNYLFSFGENIGAEDCRIPLEGKKWYPTRQPICLQHWPVRALADPRKARISTLMNWAAGQELNYAGECWGQKDSEFPKIEQLPRCFPTQSFAIVVNQTGKTAQFFPKVAIESAGWAILDPTETAKDWLDYRSFLQGSLAELSVAKATYVKAHTGWFSCRSACYLASGRPVVAQDTGWSRYYPCGEGLFSFQEEKEAKAALQELLGDYPRQSRAARRIAEAFFDSNHVLSALLEQLN